MDTDIIPLWLIYVRWTLCGISLRLTPTTRQVFGRLLEEEMVSEKEWVDRLYDVRCEPDKLIIMIVNRRQQLKNIADGAKNTEQANQPDSGK